MNQLTQKVFFGRMLNPTLNDYNEVTSTTWNGRSYDTVIVETGLENSTADGKMVTYINYTFYVYPYDLETNSLTLAKVASTDDMTTSIRLLTKQAPMHIADPWIITGRKELAV